jgi:hypothetical protein
MHGALFRLLAGSSRWPATAHGTAALGAVVAARALEGRMEMGGSAQGYWTERLVGQNC